MVTELLIERLPLSQSHIREGLANVKVPGRFQVLPGEVPVVLDVAHNPQAAQALAANLKGWSMPGRTYGVAAVMVDKEIEAIFAPLAGLIDHWCLTSVEIPRAAKPEHLAEALARAVPGAEYELCASVTEALGKVAQRVQPNDRVVVFGSFYTVAEAMQGDYNAGLSSIHNKGPRDGSST
jgi:dihydrofolate synthase/folylpolyglutamate synthase